ncbi:hypothetical protein J8L85_14740 [Maribacter sp. MMG018]|uniref:DUF6122 family protein n=1 Tax=Maribacter sp. MMG018 TaxID=2822688 RepID=UPI001B3933FC|nr:DUF6122 family protein [Maribacter sp. MMG018]MBQ4915710.1 hypothetical protein [Maribacter sp. MMG018]
MIRFFLHYGIHFIVPFIIAFIFFKQYKWKVALILLAGIIIDIDHILADPIFEADRCSINYHPLHSYWAIGVYLLMLLWKKTRIWGIAFLIHIIADITDCLLIRTNL